MIPCFALSCLLTFCPTLIEVVSDITTCVHIDHHTPSCLLSFFTLFFENIYYSYTTSIHLYDTNIFSFSNYPTLLPILNAPLSVFSFFLLLLLLYSDPPPSTSFPSFSGRFLGHLYSLPPTFLFFQALCLRQRLLYANHHVAFYVIYKPNSHFQSCADCEIS